MILFFVWFAVFFGAALIAGLLLPRWHGWRMLNIAVYPVSALGVLLLFITGEPERAARLADAQRAAAEERVESALNRIPVLDDGNRLMLEPKDLIGLLQAKVDLAEACSLSYSVSANCLAVREAMPALENAVSAYRNASGDGAEKNLEFCRSFETTVEKLQTPLVSSMALQMLIEAYREIDESSVTFASWIEARDFIELRAEGTRREISELYSSLGDPEKYENLMGIFLAQVDVMKDLFLAYATCAGLPSQLLDGTYERWQTDVEQERANRDEVLEEAEALVERNRRASSSASVFENQAWPYFLLLILAVQFGKSIADYRSKV